MWMLAGRYRRQQCVFRRFNNEITIKIVRFLIGYNGQRRVRLLLSTMIPVCVLSLLTVRVARHLNRLVSNVRREAAKHEPRLIKSYNRRPQNRKNPLIERTRYGKPRRSLRQYEWYYHKERCPMASVE